MTSLVEFLTFGFFYFIYVLTNLENVNGKNENEAIGTSLRNSSPHVDE
jgi:hypothetical protein